MFGLNINYYPLDNKGRATAALAEVTSTSIGIGTSASVDPIQLD